MSHRHFPSSIQIRSFSGPVSRRETPAAHGNVTEHQVCRCGARRRVNLNGGHREAGPWQAAAEVAA